jgi:hypothetical protein
MTNEERVAMINGKQAIMTTLPILLAKKPKHGIRKFVYEINIIN